MVNLARRFARRLANALRRDMASLLVAIPGRGLQPGLFRYERHPPGGRRVLHLRIEADESALLLIDVSDVVHLNPTAALLTKAALDGVPRRMALLQFRNRCPPRDWRKLRRNAEMVYRMVEHLATCVESCPTCRLEGMQRAPLFSRAVQAPLKADVALTYGCNNACPHCYNEPGRKAGRGMSVDRWRDVLGILARVGVPHVVFTGGEPTLVPGLEQLVETADRLGLVVGMNTNGRRLAHGTLAADLHRAGLAHVQVTIESHRADIHDAMTAPGAFTETSHGIDCCLAAGLHTVTNTTLTRRNAAEALATLSYLHDHGVRCCAFNAMIHAGRGRAHADAFAANELAPLLAALRDRAAELDVRMLWYTPTRYCELSPLELGLGARRCNAAEYSICVEPDGDVLPCQSYYHAAGNLLRDSWNDIWHGPLFRSLRHRVKAPLACGLPESCGDCPDLSVCAGGCLLESNRGIRHELPVRA